MRTTGGQALAEFALTIPIFLVIMLAVFDIGRLVFMFNTVSNAAREGARLAIVNQDESRIDTRTLAQATGFEADPNRVDISFRAASPNDDPLQNATCSPVTIGCIAVVTFETEWRPITPLVGNVVGPVTMESTTALPVEFVCPDATITAANCPKQP